MTCNSHNRTELLAPAGSIEAFFAAMECGADAVYCGLKEFSARAKAKNFTINEMARLASYAHGRNRRLYVTLNTLIKENELPRLVEILAELSSCQVDGLIIQDMGLWRIAVKHFPELSLHASTQMAVHNKAGVKMLERMGFSRAVLARELSIDEIAAIRRGTTIELEHFIHGALCYSISGQCFFSSYMNGTSGNRGRCGQPCRRRYHREEKGGSFFSTGDLCAIEVLPQLADAGIMSFKIEGRMKNAEYVAASVSAYRTVLYANPSDFRISVTEAKKILLQSYGRRTTTGFLMNSAPTDIVVTSHKTGIGLQIGTVAKSKAGSVFFTTSDVVHVGDRLRIQPHTDLAGTSFTVKDIFIGKTRVKRADAGVSVRIPTPFNNCFSQGGQIYKVSSGKTFNISEEACRRRLAATPPPVSCAAVTVSCQNNLLCVKGEAEGKTLSLQYDAEMLKAEHSPLTRETLMRVFEKTGHASLKLCDFQVGSLLPVVIRPSRLKEIRRDFYSRLAEYATVARLKKKRQQMEEAKAALMRFSDQMPAFRGAVVVRGKDCSDLPVLDVKEVEAILLPLSPQVFAEISRQENLHRYQQKIIWDLPAVIYEKEWQSFKNIIELLVDQGFGLFRLNNLGHFDFFTEHRQVRRKTGPLLYVLNSSAALAMKDLGAEEFSLSLEDDRVNMAAIVKSVSDINAAVTVYAPIPLTTSRIPMPDGASSALLESDTGQRIRLVRSGGFTIAYAGRPFSLLDQLYGLRKMGCAHFVVDLAEYGACSRQGQEILAAAVNDKSLPDTTLFNFDRGLA